MQSSSTFLQMPVKVRVVMKLIGSLIVTCEKINEMQTLKRSLSSTKANQSLSYILVKYQAILDNNR